MEVEGGEGRHRQGGLSMAAISFVYTIARVAEMLGEDEEHLDDLALYMEPEDGRLWVYGTGEEATLAFTRDGVERLRELIAEEKP
jgi:hypothetical protein